MTNIAAIGISLFQSTRPRGARPDGATGQTAAAVFQSTRPRGARREPIGGQWPFPCFNPRAREGRDGARGLQRTGQRVSIHAPARGATRYTGAWPVRRSVSIHAPARGATRVPVLRPAGRWVSIHAPARGATRFNRRHRRGHRVSIHAPARGATGRMAIDGLKEVFQSTRPRGARLAALGLVYEPVRVSIHAPARGATCAPSRDLVSSKSFQSTRPRGARRSAASIPWTILSFNPRAREGRDAGVVHVGRIHIVSIHAPARGATTHR